MSKSVLISISFLIALSFIALIANTYSDSPDIAKTGTVVIGLTYENQTVGKADKRLYSLRQFSKETGRALDQRPMILSVSSIADMIAMSSQMDEPDDIRYEPAAAVRIENRERIRLYHLIMTLPVGDWFIEAARADGKASLMQDGTLAFTVESGKTLYVGDYVYHQGFLPKGHDVDGVARSLKDAPTAMRRPIMTVPALVRFRCTRSEATTVTENRDPWLPICKPETIRVRIDQDQRNGQLAR